MVAFTNYRRSLVEFHSAQKMVTCRQSALSSQAISLRRRATNTRVGRLAIVLTFGNHSLVIYIHTWASVWPYISLCVGRSFFAAQQRQQNPVFSTAWKTSTPAWSLILHLHEVRARSEFGSRARWNDGWTRRRSERRILCAFRKASSQTVVIWLKMVTRGFHSAETLTGCSFRSTFH